MKCLSCGNVYKVPLLQPQDGGPLAWCPPCREARAAQEARDAETRQAAARLGLPRIDMDRSGETVRRIRAAEARGAALKAEAANAERRAKAGALCGETAPPDSLMRPARLEPRRQDNPGLVRAPRLAPEIEQGLDRLANEIAREAAPPPAARNFERAWQCRIQLFAFLETQTALHPAHRDRLAAIAAALNGLALALFGDARAAQKDTEE